MGVRGGAWALDRGSCRAVRAMKTTHTCGGPVFGQKTPGCPRCDELLAGAAPRAAHFTPRPVRVALPHDCKASRCAIVCTWGEW